MTIASYLIVLIPVALLAQEAQSTEGSAQWHRDTGLAYYRAGKIELTLEHLQKAIRLDPSIEQYYLDLGEVLARNNAREAVVIVFEAAQKVLPESFRIQSALGVAYLTVRNYERAKQVFTGVVRMKPSDEFGYQMLAECHDITQDWDATATIAERLRTLNPKNSQGWYYGATAEFGIRRPRGESLALAESHVRRAVELAPGDWRPPLLLGKLLADSHRDREAVTALRKAIALKSGDPKTYYILGQALKRLGQNKESVEAFKAYEEARTRQAASQRTLLVDIQ
ncbi:MAG: tetratricopeptide repeat protein [Bryobacteraceae bacterium]